jgi:hypothetical protein
MGDMRIRHLPRLLEDGFRRSQEVFPVIVVTGAGQTGKSTLVRRLELSSQHTYLTLDDVLLRDEAKRDPELLLDRGERLVVDEVQHAPNLPLAIRRRVVERRLRGQYILRGSSKSAAAARRLTKPGWTGGLPHPVAADQEGAARARKRRLWSQLLDEGCPSRPSLRVVQGEATREALLGAARDLFGARGYSETSLDAIAATAGVTKGALYYHFSGKEELFQLVFEQVMRELSSQLRLVLRDPDPWKRIVSACRKYIELHTDPAVQRIVLRDAFGHQP